LKVSWDLIAHLIVVELPEPTDAGKVALKGDRIPARLPTSSKGLVAWTGANHSQATRLSPGLR